MQTMEFIAEVLKHLAWPVTVLIILLIFGNPIRKAISFLNRLRVGNFEAEFNQNIQKIDANTEKLSAKPQQAEQQEYTNKLLKTLLDIAGKSPTAAILEAWRNVELELVRFRDIVSPDQERIPSWVIADQMLKKEIIDSEIQSLLEQLRFVRNEAAHTTGRLEIEERQAVTYIYSAIRVMEYLRDIKL